MLAAPLTLATTQLSDEQFSQLCLANPDLCVELTPSQELILIAPVGGDRGNREIELGSDLVF